MHPNFTRIRPGYYEFRFPVAPAGRSDIGIMYGVVRRQQNTSGGNQWRAELKCKARPNQTPVIGYGKTKDQAAHDAARSVVGYTVR